MSNLLSTGAAWLAGVLSTKAATTVTLRRSGKADTEDVAATKARHQQVNDQQFGDLITKEQDWIFTTADYAFDSTAVLPRRGDTIQEEGADGNTYTYEVMGDEAGIHWDWHDPHRTMIRVRTNLIESA